MRGLTLACSIKIGAEPSRTIHTFLRFPDAGALGCSLLLSFGLLSVLALLARAPLERALERITGRARRRLGRALALLALLALSLGLSLAELNVLEYYNDGCCSYERFVDNEILLPGLSWVAATSVRPFAFALGEALGAASLLLLFRQPSTRAGSRTPLVLGLAAPSHAARCPYCHDTLALESSHRRCGHCRTEHHRDCYALHGGCSVHGCDHGRARPARPVAGRATLARQATFVPRERPYLGATGPLLIALGIPLILLTTAVVKLQHTLHNVFAPSSRPRS